jgi:hypothetical protein
MATVRVEFYGCCHKDSVRYTVVWQPQMPPSFYQKKEYATGVNFCFKHCGTGGIAFISDLCDNALAHFTTAA